MKPKKIKKLEYVDEVFTNLDDVRTYDLIVRRVIGVENFEILRKKGKPEWHVFYWASRKQIKWIRRKYREVFLVEWDEEYEKLLEES